MTMSYDCLQDALLPLRESSKSAIAGAICESFGEVKDYLHLDRDVETELEEIIKSVADSEKGALVLVCGNVGDGKSHLISKVLQKHPDFRNLYRVYDDATESSSPTSTNIDELNKVLNPFADTNLSICSEKAILAINLGTLNNFLVADVDNRFVQLRKFVHNKQILEIGQLEDNTYDAESCFQFVNLCDHNLFYLTSDGPVSPIIESALEKVVSLTAYDNPFCNAYNECCSHCLAMCPIKLNYQLLQNPEIRKKVSELLIECIVKHHQIISIRALYNFIFDLIVPLELEGLSPDKIIHWGEQSSIDRILDNLFPNYLFEHPELSKVFKHLHYLDPALRRSSYLDDQIVSLITREEPSELLVELKIPSALSDLLVKHAPASERLSHDTIVKTYVRLMFLTTTNSEETRFGDIYYAEFMKLIHGWHIGDRRQLKKIYNLVRRATMTWSGVAPDDELLLEIGNQQLKYRLSGKVLIKPCPLPPQNDNCEPIRKFSCILPLKFEIGGEKSELLLNVNYRLYEVARKVDAGYRAGLADRNNFISFTVFVEDVMEAGELSSKLRITESSTGRHFVLEKDDFGDFTFRGAQQ